MRVHPRALRSVLTTWQHLQFYSMLSTVYTTSAPAEAARWRPRSPPLTPLGICLYLPSWHPLPSCCPSLPGAAAQPSAWRPHLQLSCCRRLCWRCRCHWCQCCLLRWQPLASPWALVQPFLGCLRPSVSHRCCLQLSALPCRRAWQPSLQLCRPSLLQQPLQPRLSPAPSPSWPPQQASCRGPAGRGQGMPTWSKHHNRISSWRAFGLRSCALQGCNLVAALAPAVAAVVGGCWRSLR